MRRLSVLVSFLVAVSLDICISQVNGSCCGCGAADVADTTPAEGVLPHQGGEVVSAGAAPAPVFLRVVGEDEWFEDEEEGEEADRGAAAADPDDPADGDVSYTERQVDRYWMPIQVMCKTTKACFFFREGEFLYLNAEVSNGVKFVESSDFVTAFRKKEFKIDSNAFTDEAGYPLSEQEVESLLQYLRDSETLTQADVKRLIPDSPVLEEGAVSPFAAGVAAMLAGGDI